MTELPRAAGRVQAVLDSLEGDHTVRELAASTRTAAEAAAALGCDIGAIANSLVFISDGRPLLVMTSGAHRVDVDALAGRLGVDRIARATPEDVRAATGQAIGGVAPLGHPEKIATVVDESLRGHTTLWAAAGTPHTVFATTFDELVALTQGTVLKVD